ncbi:MAG: ATP-binding protein [Planctomycetes bacterium]|nr:ATP-binding protein [Planctomycetota bacterium]
MLDVSRDSLHVSVGHVVQRICSEIQFLCKKGSLQSPGSLLFLDEIQATPHALAALRYFHEEMPELPVISAGSLLEFTLAKHNFSMPVGRVEYLFLGPLTFTEFVEAKGEKELIQLMNSFSFEEPFPESAHNQLRELLRSFLLIGGMPEVVSSYLQNHDHQEPINIQSSILETYQDDFSKYCTDSQLLMVQKVFDKIPQLIGSKIKYVNIDSDAQSRVIKTALQLLIKAGILTKVNHTDANGIPLKAEADDKVYKPYFLDCGLMNRSCRVDWISSDEMLNAKFINEGNLAEQFIAQHLLTLERENESPKLHYWLREKKSKNSEVDFVVQSNQSIIPIEVKAGKSGSLRSLNQFMNTKKAMLAMRFDLNLPSIQKVQHKVRNSEGGEDKVNYQLISLPLYMVEQHRRFI